MQPLTPDQDEPPRPNGRVLTCVGLAIIFCQLTMFDVAIRWLVEAIWGAIVLVSLVFAMTAFVKWLGRTDSSGETKQF